MSPVYPPVEIQTAGSAASAANPLPILLSSNGAAVSGANPISVTPGVIAASLNGTGTASAPLAGSAFVSVTNVPTGWYKIRGWFAITGAVETNAKNVRLSMATGGTITDFPSGMGVAAPLNFVIDAVLVSNNLDTVRLVPVNAATGATVYTGTLSLYRIA